MLLKPGLLLNQSILMLLVSFWHNIGITSEDRRHLGASIGSREFTSDYVNEKVKSWIACLLTLSKIGILCLYTWSGKQMDVFSSNDSKYSDLLKPLEDVIFHHFIPALVG